MSRILPKLVLVIGISLLGCFSVVAQSAPQLKDGKLTGAGFVLTFPPGIAPEVGTTLDSTYGFYLELPPRTPDLQSVTHDPTYRYIAFSTRWDTGDLPSLDAAVRAITSNMAASLPPGLVGSGDITLDGNFPARLAGLPARRLVLKFRNADKKPAIRQIIVAYRARKDAGAIVYELILNTTADHFGDDLPLFGKILAGFKLTPQ